MIKNELIYLVIGIFSYLRSILKFKNHENRPLTCPTIFGRKHQE